MVCGLDRVLILTPAAGTREPSEKLRKIRRLHRFRNGVHHAAHRQPPGQSLECPTCLPYSEESEGPAFINASVHPGEGRYQAHRCVPSRYRDEAQDARDTLAELIQNIPGKEAFIALMEIANAHPEENYKPWFAQQARAKAEWDADIGAWSPQQVHEFHQKLDCTPTNHRDLAELAHFRLLDLKDDLENGDSSIAGILKGVSLETDIRKYIGRELREKAFGRYSIPQEEELADSKKPDLRFLGAKFDGPVPCELKLADNWSGPDLFERLENQLCGDYLRDNRSAQVGRPSVLSEAQCQLLAEADFDRWIERRCQQYYDQEEKRGQPSDSAGRVLPHAAGRLLRGHRQPARHRLAVCRQPVAAAIPGCSAGRDDARPFDLVRHPQAVAAGSVRRGVSVRALIAEEKKLIAGKTVGVDSTMLEANAAMKSIVRRDTGEDWKAVRHAADARRRRDRERPRADGRRDSPLRQRAQEQEGQQRRVGFHHRSG